MNKPKWVTTGCQCRLTRKDGTLVWIYIYLVKNAKWRVVNEQLPALNVDYNSMTEAKKAAIANFERIESEK